MEGEDMNEDKIVSSLNAVSTFKHVTPKQMVEEQQIVQLLGWYTN